jgi:hypothetical protein
MRANLSLTKKQRSLESELRHLLSILALEPAEIIAGADPEERTPYLRLAKDQVSAVQ